MAATETTRWAVRVGDAWVRASRAPNHHDANRYALTKNLDHARLFAREGDAGVCCGVTGGEAVKACVVFA